MKIFKNMRKYLLIEALFSLIMGLCLLFAPRTTLQTIIYFIAAFLAIGGIINIVTFIRLKKEYTSMNNFLISGVLLLILSLILVRTSVVEVLLPIVIGIVIVLGGCSNLTYALDVRNNPESKWVAVLIYGIISIIAGIIILFNPFSSVPVIIMACGILMLCRTVGDIMVYFTMRKIKNHVEDKINEFR